MTHSATPANKIHEGRNVKRFREMMGVKQDTLAADLGDDWNQQKISLLERDHRSCHPAADISGIGNTSGGFSEV